MIYSKFLYTCDGCHKGFTMPEGQVAEICPECGAKLTLNPACVKEATEILPFELSEEQALKLVIGESRSFMHRPVNLAKRLKAEKAFVPFWLFSSDVSGNVTVKGTRISDRLTSEERVTLYANYEGAGELIDVPVDASIRARDSLMDKLSPFDFSKLTDVEDSITRNAKVYEVDTPFSTCISRAKAIMAENLATKLCADEFGMTDIQMINTQDVQLSNCRARMVLLPVYFIKLDEEEYTIAVNGQTGEIAGDKPSGLLWKTALIALIFSVCLLPPLVGVYNHYEHPGIALFSIVAAFVLYAVIYKLTEPKRQNYRDIPADYVLSYEKKRGGIVNSEIKNTSKLDDPNLAASFGRILGHVFYFIFRIIFEVGIDILLSAIFGGGGGGSHHSSGSRSSGSRSSGSFGGFGGGSSRGSGAGRGR